MRGPADAEWLLERLVAFPTVAGQPNQALIEFVHDWLKDQGARVTVTPSDWRADGYNLHAVLGPESDGGILLAAHTDVVAVDGQSWTSDPFSVRRSDGRLYGRGTTDMKGFIAATLAAIAKASPRRLREPVAVALSCDEELGCKGVVSLLDELAGASSRPSLCLIGEPTRMRIADRHKGKVSLRVEVSGRAAHSSVPARGVNAVTFAAHLVAKLDQLSGELDRGPGDDAFAVPHATLSVGPIQRRGIAQHRPRPLRVRVRAPLPARRRSPTPAAADPRLRPDGRREDARAGTRSRRRTHRGRGIPALEPISRRRWQC